MTRYKLTLEYDGTPFQGWQTQDSGPSVQDCLEEAIFLFCQERVRVQGAGRTDAGVHALAQIAHADIEKETSADILRDALNFHLAPQPIAVTGAEAVHPAFHARFSATKRSYRYVIVNRRARLALEDHHAWHVPRLLNDGAMHKGAQQLVGQHDFTTFRSSQCQARSPLKTLDRLTVRREGEHVFIDAEARSFLHNQVRSMVGSLVLVGEGKWAPQRMGEALRARDRAACGPVAPPHGLYLMAVDYAGTSD
jgi:tRNA pseudouridine38-40 synthase